MANLGCLLDTSEKRKPHPKLPPSYWLVGISLEHIFTAILYSRTQTTVRGAIYKQVSMDWVRKVAECEPEISQ